MPGVANIALGEDELVDAAVVWLRESLPGSWEVGRSRRAMTGVPRAARRLDAAIDVRASDGTSTTLVVEARRAFSPRDVELLFSGVARSLRALASHIPVLVVAPWLSPRTQELLAAENVNYLDLAGNARLQLDHPALYLKSLGEQRNPAPAPRGQARLRGPKAGRLVRLLADVQPPYGVRELAVVADINPGYVSRLLDALDREALIDRDPRGPVRSADVPALLRRWAQSYDVFKANNASGFLAPAGPGAALEHLASKNIAGRVAITGSFAAVRRAPVAAPAFLTVYCNDADADALAAELRLLPADTGANVASCVPTTLSSGPARTATTVSSMRPSPRWRWTASPVTGGCPRRARPYWNGCRKTRRSGAPRRWRRSCRSLRRRERVVTRSAHRGQSRLGRRAPPAARCPSAADVCAHRRRRPGDLPAHSGRDEFAPVERRAAGRPRRGCQLHSRSCIPPAIVSTNRRNRGSSIDRIG